MNVIENLKFKIFNFPLAGGLKTSALRAAGFTLIEVIITMVIISTLIGIGTLNYMTVQRSGRDTARESDLKRMQNALELYYSDNHGYPPLGDCSSVDTWVEANELADYLVPTGLDEKSYLDQQPCDPLDDNEEAPCAPDDDAAYYFCKFPDSECYCVVAEMEKSDNAYSEGSCGPGSYEKSDITDGYYVTCP